MEQEAEVDENLEWSPAVKRFAALIGVELQPWTAEEEVAFQSWMKRGDDAVAAWREGQKKVGPRSDT